jgi:hypothetical protein
MSISLRAAIAFVVLTPGVAVAQMVDATTYRFRTSTEIKGLPAGMGPAPGGMFVMGRVSASGQKVRFDVQAMEPAMGVLAPGMTMLVDTGRTMIVQPDQQQVLEFSGANARMSAMTGGRGGRGGMAGMAATPDMMRNMDVSASRVVVEKLGADTVEGRQTQKYRVSVEFSVNFMGQTQTMQTETDMWMADLPYTLANPMQPTNTGMSLGPIALPSDTTGMPAGVKEFVRKMADATKDMKGTAVKTVTTLNLGAMMAGRGMDPSMMGGMNIQMVQTTIFSGIKAEKVEASQFEAPAGYKVVKP